MGRAATWIDHKIGWDAFPPLTGLLVLLGLRTVLRRDNLYDTHSPQSEPDPPPYDPTALTRRTVDGSYNDLDQPSMGMAGRRFGRNVAPAVARPETDTLLTPNPRQVSRRLMTRETFQPATSVNILAATWIQFMVKDWLSHGPGDAASGFALDLEPDDPWPAEARPLVIPRLIPDPRTY